MSEIIKTEAVVLSKLNYGDTSKIVTLYSKDFGKISAMIKGGRSPKSKIGMVIDPLNHIQIILYSKETRELQIISSADLISHFPGIKEELEKLKYSQAILELLKNLLPEREANLRLFKGVLRILSLLELSSEQPIILFGRFFLFFLSELGYEVQLDKCAVCGKTNLEKIELSYIYELGILCSNCRKNYAETYTLTSELFNYLNCLKNSKKIEITDPAVAEKAIVFMEKYLKFHVSDFKGIQSIQLFK